MSTTLSKSTGSHSNEFSLLLHFFDAKSTAIAHSASNTINKLHKDISKRASIGNIALHTFSSIFLRVSFFGAHSLIFRNISSKPSHTSENLDQFSISVKHFGGGLFATSHQSTQHHAISPSSQGLTHVTTKSILNKIFTPPSEIKGTSCSLQIFYTSKRADN